MLGGLKCTNSCAKTNIRDGVSFAQPLHLRRGVPAKAFLIGMREGVPIEISATMLDIFACYLLKVTHVFVAHC